MVEERNKGGTEGWKRGRGEEGKKGIGEEWFHWRGQKRMPP
jgi:hypothetical protein